ncbi:MAG TPA: HemK/PrmC family methyltransferase [Candidatus Saccharimonadales bacterium]|nr:HemK/PrmC family methyltransferase [Candidatus Saccharimonadales bacterium]
MTADHWLRAATATLQTAGIGTARLDALVLLEDVTGHDRAWLLAHPDHPLAPAEAAKLTKLLKRRARHEPLAYVRGRTEFYGRNFVITPAVLEPRPESETMIDLLRRLPGVRKSGSSGSKTLRIADVGAGSGALGITAELELKTTQKVAVDLLEIDPEAAKIAQSNVENHTTKSRVTQSDLLEQSPRDYDLLLCNLPYVPDNHTVNQAALHEPRLAIFGGPDGLDVYRRLCQQIAALHKQPLYILTESLPPQHGALQQIAAAAGYKLITTDDFIQVYGFGGQ